jgi:5-methylcytosine-specific restriction protein A
MAKAPTKQAIMNDISDLLGIERFPVSRGSTEPREFLNAVASAIGVSIDAFDSKQLLAEAVAKRLGQEWDSSCDSRDRPASGGGTVTAEGLSRILRGLRARAATEEQRFELQLESRMADTSLPRLRPVGVTAPTKVRASAMSFRRSVEVAEWVLKQAKGKCELCGNPAPFVRVTGEGYLEVHHVQPLAEGGPDTVDNAVAVCPNCHRAAHHSRDASTIASRLREYVLDRASSQTRER